MHINVTITIHTGLQFTTSNDPSSNDPSRLDVTRVEWYQGNNKFIPSYGGYLYLTHSGIVTTDDEGLQYTAPLGM